MNIYRAHECDTVVLRKVCPENVAAERAWSFAARLYPLSLFFQTFLNFQEKKLDFSSLFFSVSEISGTVAFLGQTPTNDSTTPARK